MEESVSRSRNPSTLRALAVLENNTAAYCIIKSRPIGNFSYEQILAAHNDNTGLDMGTPSTIVIIPGNSFTAYEESETLSGYAMHELRKVLQDEAKPIDVADTPGRSSVWYLPADSLVVLGALSRIGFETSQCHVDADGVHTWTLRCCSGHATATVQDETQLGSDGKRTVDAPKQPTHKVVQCKRKRSIGGTVRSADSMQEENGEAGVGVLGSPYNDNTEEDGNDVSLPNSFDRVADSDGDDFNTNHLTSQKKRVRRANTETKLQSSNSSIKPSVVKVFGRSESIATLEAPPDFDSFIGKVTSLKPTGSAAAEPVGKTCPVCDRTFPTTHNCRRHMLSHTGQMPFSCLLCGKRSSRKEQIVHHIQKLHMRT